MANDFDSFPVYDPIIQSGTSSMSPIWRDFMATFYMNLIGYLTQGGILVPRLTTDQRDDLQNVQNGQMIYNTTLDKFQGYESNTWTNLI